MTKTITLVTRDSNDLVTEQAIGTAPTKTAAMKIAKKAAGRGATFRGDQGRCEYRGPNGTACVVGGE